MLYRYGGRGTYGDAWLFCQESALNSSFRWNQKPSPWRSRLPLLVTALTAAPAERPMSAVWLLVSILNSATVSMLIHTAQHPLMPLSMLVMPSILKLIWSVRPPFTLALYGLALTTPGTRAMRF